MFFRFVRNLRNFRRSFASPNFYRASLIKTAVLINSAQQDKENPPKFKDFFTGTEDLANWEYSLTVFKNCDDYIFWTRLKQGGGHIITVPRDSLHAEFPIQNSSSMRRGLYSANEVLIDKSMEKTRRCDVSVDIREYDDSYHTTISYRFLETDKVYSVRLFTARHSRYSRHVTFQYKVIAERIWG